MLRLAVMAAAARPRMRDKREAEESIVLISRGSNEE